MNSSKEFEHQRHGHYFQGPQPGPQVYDWKCKTILGILKNSIKITTVTLFFPFVTFATVVQHLNRKKLKFYSILSGLLLFLTISSLITAINFCYLYKNQIIIANSRNRISQNYGNTYSSDSNHSEALKQAICLFIVSSCSGLLFYVIYVLLLFCMRKKVMLDRGIEYKFCENFFKSCFGCCILCESAAEYDVEGDFFRVWCE